MEILNAMESTGGRIILECSADPSEISGVMEYIVPPTVHSRLYLHTQSDEERLYKPKIPSSVDKTGDLYNVGFTDGTYCTVDVSCITPEFTAFCKAVIDEMYGGSVYRYIENATKKLWLCLVNGDITCSNLSVNDIDNVDMSNDGVSAYVSADSQDEALLKAARIFDGSGNNIYIYYDNGDIYKTVYTENVGGLFGKKWCCTCTKNLSYIYVFAKSEPVAKQYGRMYFLEHKGE